MKKKQMLIIAAFIGALLCSLCLFACDGEPDMGDFDYLPCDGGYRIVDYTSNESDVEIPATYNGKPVVYVRLDGKKQIKSVVLPDSVTVFSFSNCTNLKSITLGDSVEEITDFALSGCAELTHISLPDTVKEIGSRAFDGCAGLTSIKIPDNVASIGDMAFRDCSALAEVSFGSGLRSIGDSAFYECSALKGVEIPNGVTEMGARVFYGCEKLGSVSLGNGSKEIADRMFSGCTSLAEIEIPTSVASIGDSAFSGCTSLAEIEIPTSVASIGRDMLKNCTGIVNAIIPMAAVGSIPKTNLQTVVITNGTELSEKAFYKAGKLTSVTLPTNLVKIGQESFSDCVNLTELDIPESVTEIGSAAFYNCGNLMTANIPSGVTEIGWGAYYGCNKLTEIVIPDGVSKIPYSAFSGCKNLMRLTIGSGVTTVDSEAFNNCCRIAEINNRSSLDISNYFYYSVVHVYGDGGESTFTVTDDGFAFCKDDTGANYLVGYTGDSKRLTLPDKFENGGYIINSYAFAYNYGIVSVTLSKGVTEIKHDAFYGCYKLAEIYNRSDLDVTAGESENGEVARSAINVFGDGNGTSKIKETADGYIFYIDDVADAYYLLGHKGNETELTLPEKINNKEYEIYRYAFAYSAVESVVIPDGVKSIGQSSFDGCSYLRDISISDSVKSVERYAFRNCSMLKYTDGDGCRYLGNAENEYLVLCDSLGQRGDAVGTSIEIKEGTKIIANDAFVDFSKLTSVTIPNSVTHIGDGAFAVGRYGGSAPMQDGLTKVVIPDSVKYIGNAAFLNRVGLSELTLGNSVEYIGGSAFSGSALTSITLPASVKFIGYTGVNKIDYKGTIENWLKIEKASGLAERYDLYIGGVKVTEIVIPTTITAIPNYEFCGMSCLENVILHDGITEIGDRAFFGCTSLSEVDIPTSITLIGEDAFSGAGLTSISIPDNVNIKTGAFGGCEALTSITAGSGVQVEWSSYRPVFGGCNKLNTLTVHADSLSQMSQLQDRITSLTVNGGTLENIREWSPSEFILGEGLEGIGESAFKNCSWLTEIEVPSTVTSIAKGAFAGCNNLESITLPFVGIGAGAKTEERLFGAIFGSTSSFGLYLAEQCTVLYETTMLTTPYYIPSSLKSVTVTGGDVPFGAFSNCTSLESITLDGVSGDTIRGYTFYGCSGLSEYVIPDNIAEIEQNAFENCTSLASIDLNKTGVIRSYAFAGCTSLENIVIPQYMWSIGWDIFKGCSNLTSVTFADTEWLYMQNESTGEGEIDLDMSDPAANVTHMTVTYKNKTLVNKRYWDMSTKPQP